MGSNGIPYSDVKGGSGRKELTYTCRTIFLHYLPHPQTPGQTAIYMYGGEKEPSVKLCGVTSNIPPGSSKR